MSTETILHFFFNIMLVCIGAYAILHEKELARLERKATKYIKAFFKALYLEIKERVRLINVTNEINNLRQGVNCRYKGEIRLKTEGKEYDLKLSILLNMYILESGTYKRAGIEMPAESLQAYILLKREYIKRINERSGKNA